MLSTFRGCLLYPIFGSILRRSGASNYWRNLRGLALACMVCGQAMADGIQAAGDILQYAMPATAAGITAVHRDWQGTWQFAEAFAVQGVTVLALKNTVYETRPNGEGHQSFPSGHAAVTFASAEFLRERYGWAYGAPAYALAAFTGYSRVESDHHYWHDVAAGAGIGIVSSWLFTTSYKDWTIQPTADGHSIRFALAHPW